MSHCSSAPLYLYLSIRPSTLDTVGGIVADGPRVARDESLNQNDVLAIYHGTIYHLPMVPCPAHSTERIEGSACNSLKYLMASLAVDRSGGSGGSATCRLVSLTTKLQLQSTSTAAAAATAAEALFIGLSLLKLYGKIKREKKHKRHPDLWPKCIFIRPARGERNRGRSHSRSWRGAHVFIWTNERTCDDKTTRNPCPVPVPVPLPSSYSSPVALPPAPASSMLYDAAFDMRRHFHKPIKPAEK